MRPQAKQPIIALYFESENELKFYNLEALPSAAHVSGDLGVLVAIATGRICPFVVSEVDGLEMTTASNHCPPVKETV